MVSYLLLTLTGCGDKMSQPDQSLRMFTRAYKMKRRDDGAIVVHPPGQELAESRIKKDSEVLSKFSHRYGFPFSFNLSHSNGATRGVKANGTCDHHEDASKVRAKFRRAGMKARLARRMEKIVEERMTVKQIFKRYVQNSTLHGFRFIFMQTFFVRRFAWLAITVAMAVFFFKELKESIELFYQYPFSTTSTIEYVDYLKFPAISICNLNEFPISKLNKTNLKLLYDRGQFPTNIRWSDLRQDVSGEELTRILRQSSPSLEHLFQQCEWKQRDTNSRNGIPNLCHNGNFTSYTDLNGQLCYTFNSGKADHPLLWLNETGLNMALKLELDLRTNESLKMAEEVGLRVIVHDQSETPLQTAGFVVSPGFQTFVEINVRKTVNLKPPYETKCGARPLKFSRDYRQSKCFLEQLSQHVYKSCGCRGVFLPGKSVRLCSLNETVTCLTPAINSFDKRTNTDCPVDCESTQYITSLSYARFLANPPIGLGLVQNRGAYLYNLSQRFTDKQLRKYIQENIVVIQFFFQEMKVENVAQEPTYDFYKLVGDVGGQLGLMLGASVLTLMEFVDLFLFTLYHQLLRLSRRKKQEREERRSTVVRQSMLASFQN